MRGLVLIICRSGSRRGRGRERKKDRTEEKSRKGKMRSENGGDC